MTSRPEKSCAVCGRPMQWRLRWARVWDEVRYCSDRCRGARSRSGERGRIEAAVLSLLDERSADATLCPSEVARAIEPQDWRALMEPVREAGRRLAAEGLVEWTQQGHRVDPATARGPVRFRRPRR